MKQIHPGLRKELQYLFGTKSTKKAALAVSLNWMFFLLCYYLIGLAMKLPPICASLLYVLLSFVAGCCLRGFDNLTHEASHNNIFLHANLHHSLQFLFSYPVFKTVEDYRPGHWKHHRNYRNNKDDDPDTQQNIRWGVEFLPAKKTMYQVLWFYVIRLLLLYYFFDNIRYSFIPHSSSKHSKGGRLIFWFVILGVIAVTNSWLCFLLGYLIPCLFWLPYIRFVTESSKHTNVRLESDFANSRNNIGILHQLLLHPHNDGFHQMHHYMASIPFYNLKKAYRYMKLKGGIGENTIESYSPIETIKQVFIKK
jgi:fatty acid desaturase